ncbi:hypothetical protein ACFLW6_01365 [Chloroflexota bacterium]
MMNNQDMQNQFQIVRQMAQQKGISGVAYIDVHPTSGFLRFKLKVAALEQRAEMISNFALMLEMMSQAFNLQVNTRTKTDEEANNG